MCANPFEKDSLLAVVLNEFEDDSKIVSCAARPGASEVPFEFMSSEALIKSVLGQ